MNPGDIDIGDVGAIEAQTFLLERGACYWNAS
jgi:hypothetical protein